MDQHITVADGENLLTGDQAKVGALVAFSIIVRLHARIGIDVDKRTRMIMLAAMSQKVDPKLSDSNAPNARSTIALP
jgi:hypothetical protein